MASRKQEIRKEIKKKNAKLGIDVEAAKNIVDLQDQQGEDIHVEDFKNEEYNGEVIPFSTTPQKTKKGFVSKIKGVFDDERKQLKKLDKIAQEIISLEDKYSALSDEELANQTNVLKEKLNNGSELDDILIDAFAVAREAAWRQIHLKAFKVQLMGGIALHNGDIAEMKTGEGKTLTSIFPVYLNALTGKGVHVITVNDYLAERDARNNGKVLEFLGLTVGLNKRELTPQQKQEAHGCDVTYTTNAELGFDYLRDNMVIHMADRVQRELNLCIVDEVDSILIDEARTPLIISGMGDKSTKFYNVADNFVKTLINEKDFNVDEKASAVLLTDDGIVKAEKYFGIENYADSQNLELQHYVTQALKANYTMKADKDYMVKDNEIVIIDEFTGRLMEGRRYSDGLHQAIEAKEGVKIQRESKTLATITFQNYFRMYAKLSGMTGTALTEENEFKLTPELLKEAINEKTKAILLNYPSNPTGGFMTKEDYEKLVPIFKESGIMIITDEIYAELSYEHKFCSIASFDEIKDQVILVSGFSKAYAMTGWRLGYVLANEYLIKMMKKIHQYVIMSAPTCAQYGAIEAMRHCDEEIEKMRQAYLARRNFLVKTFNEMGLKTFTPQGAFYVFPCIKSTGLTSEQFCEELLNDQLVACVPGSAFGEAGEGYIRVSYAYSLEELKAATKKIRKFLKNKGVI